MSLQRWAVGVEYDGSAFHGWQRQSNGNSVQAEVERALSRVAGHPLTVQCAGRTDTGVHASGQVIHFDSPAPRTPRNWILGGNVNLPPEIGLQWALPVPPDFHARFSARARSYRYRILNRPTRSPLHQRYTTWIHPPLDLERMAAAARPLIGHHDFSAYRASGCQAKSPQRSVTHLTVTRHGEELIITIRANAFLHHMVRNIAGVLITIGKGERPIEWSEEILHLRDRSLGGITAPPQGLCLTQVEYPDTFQLAAAIARLRSEREGALGS